jgi:hypothetical protein
MRRARRLRNDGALCLKQGGDMSRVIRVSKAQGIRRNEEIVSARIEISETVESDGRSLEEMRALYQAEARGLADVLSDSLPGGTMHELLIELLQRKACYLVIPINK